MKKIEFDLKSIIISEETKILRDQDIKNLFSQDLGEIPNIMKSLFNTNPFIIIQSRNISDISKIFQIANKRKIPIIPRGSASSGFGGVLPTKGGIIFDTSFLQKIINLNIETQEITVESGVRWNDIDLFVQTQNLALFTYPSSKFSTIGGWISTGGYGINNFKYGHVKKQIKSLKVIYPNGEVKTLNSDQEEFNYFIGTEGQFGLILEITLKLKQVSSLTPYFFYFKETKKTFEFIENLIEKEIKPTTIKFIDKEHLQEVNKLLKENLFLNQDGVLIVFDDQKENALFLQYIETISEKNQALNYIANYLWNERFFSMKVKKLGPTILAAELIFPIEKIPAFIAKTKKIQKSWGINISTEVIIINKKQGMAISSFLCDSRSSFKYILFLALVPALTRLGIKLKGIPYGIGIWNTPFVKNKFKEKFNQYKKYKKEIDPCHIFNTNKFFSLKTRFFNIPGLMFKPFIFNLLMDIILFLSPILGKLVTSKKEKKAKSDFEMQPIMCARCGNCIANCPAYLITKDERVTAKAKLFLIKKLLKKEKISQEEAHIAFCCLHCKQCEKVCQTNLDLIPTWEELENKLKNKFGKPNILIEEFVKKVEDSNQYWEMVDRTP